MSKSKGRNQARARDKPIEQRNAPSPAVGWFFSQDAKEALTVPGYTRLADCPEVKAAVNWIADRVSSATIALYENTDSGDKRIKDGLSRLIDIEPNPSMTRKTFITSIVRTLYLEGEGNQITLPITENGYLAKLIPVPASRVSFINLGGDSYIISVNGKDYSPESVLHFILNPNPEYMFLGSGFRVTLKDVTATLRQSTATRKGFMGDKWKPSVIIRVADYPDMTPEGRKKILDEFMGPTEAGEPWIVPTDVMEVATVKPLTLQDLAINDSVTLDKKTVAAMLGVPLYSVGAGSFNKEEHNNCIRTTVTHVTQIIQQELTRKLLLSPKRYFSFLSRSLFAYDIRELANVGDTLAGHGLMMGNEVRDWIGLSPLEGLDELKALENYIPLEMIGVQKKLQGSEKNEDT